MLLVVSAVTGDPELFVWSAVFEMLLYLYAALSMLAYMLDDDRVTTDELFAIPAVFTLLAWAFAYLFVVVQALDPGGFNPDGQGTRTWMELLFLSFTTLSSTGLSDITPISGHARSVVMIEQVAGVFYIAMVVTRLVALRGQRRRREAGVSGARARPRPRAAVGPPGPLLGGRGAGRDRPTGPGRRRRARHLRAGHQRDPARPPADRRPRRRHGRAPAGGGPRHLEHPAADARHVRPRPAARDGRPRAGHRGDVLHELGRRGVPAGQDRLVRAGRRDRGPESGPAPAGEVFDLGGVVDQRLAGAGEPADRIDVHLLSMPVQVFAHYRGWYDELRRELRLLALNHAVDYPFASELSELTLQVEQERRQAVGIDRLDAAIAAGDDRVDLVYRVPVTAGATMGRLRALLEQADVFCREQRLLTLEPAPQQLALRNWYLGEFTRQADGEQPRPWPGSFTVEVPPR